MRQSFKTTDILRLDLERPPAAGELVSLVENPDGELGGWGWITPAGAVTGGTVGGQRRLWYFAGSSARMETETRRAVPGQWLRATWILPAIARAGAYYRAHVEFRSADDTVISSALLHSGTASASRVLSAAVQVKPGTASARLAFTFATDSGMGTALPSGTRVDLTGVKWAAAPTPDALAGIADAQVAYYADVLGPTHEIGIGRDGFNVATLSATVIDATLDPSQSDIVRPGRRVRLVATVNGSDEVLFTGKTLTAKVSYDLTRSDAKERARIVLSAVDAFTDAAKAKRADGVGTINELPYVLEGAGVPWDVNGYSGQYVGANIVAVHPEASALDQVAITRDSNLGYAWFSRRGVLTVHDRSQMTTAPAATLDETVYNGDLVVDYDPDQVMNTLSVKALVVDAWDDTVEAEFGPFVDQDSVDEWGPQSAEFTVQGIPATQDDEGNWSSAAIATLAAMILINTGQPERRVQSLTVPITTTAALPHALRDLYDLVRVVNERADIDQDLRVTGIKHAITPEKWLMTLTFNGDGVVGQPSQVPSVPVSTTAVKEAVDEQETQLGDVGQTIGNLLDEMDSQQEFAQTRNSTFRQGLPPSGTSGAPLRPGDLWFNTADGNRIHIYNGSAWIEATGSNLITPNGRLYVNANGMYATNPDGALTFALNAETGNITMNGNLASVEIAGAIVTGGTVQTSDQARRGVKMSHTGIAAYHPSTGQPVLEFLTSTGDLAILGNLRAGSTIEGAQILGPLKTASSGARMEITSDGFQCYNSAGVAIMGFSAAYQNAWFNGSLSADQITSGSFSTDRLRVNSGGAVQFNTSVWVLGGPLLVEGTPTVGGISTGGRVSAGGDVSGQNLTTTGFVSADLALVGASVVSRSQTGSGTVSASIDANGTLVRGGSSTLRKKTLVGGVEVDPGAVLALDPILYTLHAEEAEMDTPPVYAGFVAEQAHDLGLTPWVYYDAEGQPDGIHYNALVAAQQVVLRDHEARIADLADRLTALEAA